uniref:Transmembrane protein n=1 Tax=Cacopsylla melanoneura TaxID=428564 RepID=A0A8D8W7A8_9HEMI
MYRYECMLVLLVHKGFYLSSCWGATLVFVFVSMFNLLRVTAVWWSWDSDKSLSVVVLVLVNVGGFVLLFVMCNRRDGGGFVLNFILGFDNLVSSCFLRTLFDMSEVSCCGSL